MLGSILKQIVVGLEEIPDKIVQAYEDQKKVIGGRGLRLPEIVEMLQTTSSSRSTFICIDALDECVVGHRHKILGSLKQILEKSPNTRVFLTGRPHIRGEVDSRLARRAATVSISPIKDDIASYLRARLEEDPNPDAMDSRLEAEILKKIPETISEMYVVVQRWEAHLLLCYPLTNIHPDFCWFPSILRQSCEKQPSLAGEKGLTQ